MRHDTLDERPSIFRDVTAGTTLFLGSATIYTGGNEQLYPLLLPLSFCLSVLFREFNQRKRTDFVNQLRSCRRELRTGGTVYIDGLSLRAESELTSYSWTVGGLISNVVVHSPYRPTEDGVSGESSLYSLASLFTGWWSFPMGPLLTLGAIFRNTKGGKREKVRDIIDGDLATSLAQDAF